jgi:membrane-associated phospholipid phosphatase
MAARCVAAGICALALVFANGRTAHAADPNRVEWSDDWPRIRFWEAIDAVALTIGDTEIEEQVAIPSSPHWRGGILFDDWARSVFRGNSPAVQSTASTVSDALYYGGTLVPFIVDNYFVTLDVHKSADVALQMFFINMQSLGVSGLVSLTAEHTVGRARPYTESCDANGDVHDASGGLLPTRCGSSNDNRSFFSGHVTAVSTMAGLTCVHHQHLPLYGGGFADLAPCLFMMGVAVTTGILRLVYDEHWASDVMAGWAVGALSGYVLPSVLHYGFGGGRPVELQAGGLTMVPSLQGRTGGATVGVLGVF